MTKLPIKALVSRFVKTPGLPTASKAFATSSVNHPMANGAVLPTPRIAE